MQNQEKVQYKEKSFFSFIRKKSDTFSDFYQTHQARDVEPSASGRQPFSRSQISVPRVSLEGQAITTRP